MKKILVIGQVPPPIGGQSVMIKTMIDAHYTGISIRHIPMRFSREMGELGRFQLRKIVHLFEIILRVYWKRIVERPEVLYFPPSGPGRAVLRDMAILLSTRFLFKKTVFHFHASGLGENYGALGAVGKWLFRACFFEPDLCIHNSELNLQDGRALRSRKDRIIPYGINDLASSEAASGLEPGKEDGLRVLFIGMLDSTKGELDLMEAVKRNKDDGVRVGVRIAGQFKSREYRDEFFEKRRRLGLEGEVEYLGVIQGGEKVRAFRWANVFCFPTFFSSESFGLVLIEAMQFSLPIVATRWRGVPDLVEDGSNGFLVDIRKPEMIADRLKRLAGDPALRERMGRDGRMKYDRDHRLQTFIERMEEALSEV